MHVDRRAANRIQDSHTPLLHSQRNCSVSSLAASSQIKQKTNQIQGKIDCHHLKTANKSSSTVLVSARHTHNSHALRARLTYWLHIILVCPFVCDAFCLSWPSLLFCCLLYSRCVATSSAFSGFIAAAFFIFYVLSFATILFHLFHFFSANESDVMIDAASTNNTKVQNMLKKNEVTNSARDSDARDLRRHLVIWRRATFTVTNQEVQRIHSNTYLLPTSSDKERLSGLLFTLRRFPDRPDWATCSVILVLQSSRIWSDSLRYTSQYY